LVTLRTDRNRQDADARATNIAVLRERSAAVFAEFMVVVQAIEWITWYGTADPEALDRELIRSYESDVNESYKRLLGAIAASAAINLTVHAEMQDTLNSLYDLESNVAIALRTFVRDRSRKSAEQLSNYKHEAKAMREQMPQELNRIMGLAEIETTGSKATGRLMPNGTDSPYVATSTQNDS
jgi:hypothetical protein